MRESRRADRRTQIEAAAQALLAERGYAATSMLEVAKRAKASNETLYRWYGDKNGLFAAMVKRNASAGLERLQDAMDDDGPLEDKLMRFGFALLRGILSDSAVELNRAAIADPTGELRQSLAQHGRDTVVPLLEKVMAQASLGGEISGSRDAADTFITLLVGDLQVRRAIGAVPAPDDAFCHARVRQAVRRFQRLIT